MAIKSVKLSEVNLIETAEQPNLLVEDGGEIKRISATNINIAVPQVHADWNIDDPNNPAFILNKPEIVNNNSSSTAETRVYYFNTESIYYEADFVNLVNAQDVVDAWNANCIIKINYIEGTTENGAVYSSLVTSVYYTLNNSTVTGCSVKFTAPNDQSISVRLEGVRPQ